MGEMTAADKQLIAKRILLATAVFAALCLLIWLLFLRTNKPTNKISSSSGDTQQATQQNAPSDVAVNPQTGQSPPNTQVAGQPEYLANTGPGDTLSFFFIVVATSALAHSLYKRHTSNSP